MKKGQLYIWGGIIAVSVLVIVIFSGSGKSMVQDSIDQDIPIVATTEIIATGTSPISNTSLKYYAISSVVDGDTVKINVDGKIETFRLIGIDTPEIVDPRTTVQCFGQESSEKARELLSGKRVRIETDPTQGTYDKYNRLLAYIYRDDGLFYNKYMVEQGYAYEYTYNAPYKYQTDFKNAQKVAQANKAGLWSPNTCNGSTTISSPSNSTPPPSATTQSDVQFYTSSYSTSKYYYPASCDGWKGLSPKYLKGFSTLDDLLKAYPTRKTSPGC